MQRLNVIALALAAPVVLCTTACSDQQAPTEATRTPATVVAGGSLYAGPVHAGGIVAHDSCDPDSFNAAIGPGTCLKNGRTTFAEFIAQLQATGVAQDWKFSSEHLTARLGVDLLGNNVGGEEHTFTPVRAFGGGMVPILNTLSGNPVPAPECLALDEDDLVAVGGKYLVESEELADVADAGGIARVQCCIHPWMRTEVRMQR